jgi:iron complex transport system substrate-binding protein
MTVGGDTYINNLLQTCGLQNVFANEQRYPITTIETTTTNLHQLLSFLSTEPYPFKQKHVDRTYNQQLPNSKVHDCGW